MTFQVTIMFGLSFMSFLLAILNVAGLFLLLIGILIMFFESHFEVKFKTAGF